MAEVTVRAGQVWVRNWRTSTYHVVVDVGRRVRGSSGLMPARTACRRKMFVIAASELTPQNKATCQVCSRTDRWFQQQTSTIVAWVERPAEFREDQWGLTRHVPTQSWIYHLDWEVSCALRVAGFEGKKLAELVEQMI